MSNFKDITSNPFWMSIKNNFNVGESIESILKSPECTVELLLEDDNFASECRSNHHKLISFLTKKKNMKKLLEYIIEEPSPEASHNRGHKFPFLVSDVLSSDNSTLLDVFFSEEHKKAEEPEEHEEPEEPEEAEGDMDEEIESLNAYRESLKKDPSIPQDRLEDIFSRIELK